MATDTISGGDVGQGGIDLKMSADGNAKKALEVMDLNNDGVIDAHEVVAYAQKGEKRKTWNYVLAVSLVIVIVVAVIIIVVLVNQNNELRGQTKTEAVTSIGDVVTDVINVLNTSNADLNSTEVANLSDTETNALLTAFNTFDADGDGAWNLDEFQEHLLFSMKTDTVFNTIDIDGDGIWSFREMIAFLQALNGTSPYFSKVFDYVLFPAITERYAVTNNSDYAIFEYAAAYLFEMYDPYYKGYVTLPQYLLYNANSTFIAMDIDNDKSISFDEYINSSFNAGTLTLISSSGILDASNYFNSSNVSTILQLTEAGVLARDIYDCPNMNLISSVYYDITVRRRLSWGACAGTAGGCGGAAIGCGICTVLTLGVCGPPCAVGIGSACGAAIGVCSYTGATGGCFSADSMVKALNHNNNGDAVVDKLVRDVKIGDYILTSYGFEKVIHSAHFIKEDKNDTLIYQRQLCSDDECITMSYMHMIYTGDNMDTLKPASDMKIGDIMYVLNTELIENDFEFSYKKVKIFSIQENVISQMRNIFTESGTIIVDNVIASSYTGNSKYDAYIQHAMLKLFVNIISFYDENLLADQYEMYKLRHCIYYHVVKPINSFINGAYNTPESLNVMAIAVTFMVTTVFIKSYQ